MVKIIEVTKKLVGVQIQKSVLKQKNEWPATCFPIYFQPERPKDKIANKISDAKK